MKSSRTGLLIGLCAVIAVFCMTFMPHEAVIARTMTASPGAVLEAAPGDDKGDVPSAASTALRAKMADAAAVPHTMESVRRAMIEGQPEFWKGLPWPASVYDGCCALPSPDTDLSTVPSVDSGDCFITCPKVHPEFFEHDTRRLHFFSEQKTGSSTTGVMLNKATDLAGQLLGYNKTLVVKGPSGPGSGWQVEVNHKSAWAEVGSVKKHRRPKTNGMDLLLVEGVRDPMDQLLSMYNYEMRNKDHLSFDELCGGGNDMPGKPDRYTCKEVFTRYANSPIASLRYFEERLFGGYATLMFDNMKADPESLVAEALVLAGFDVFHPNMSAVHAAVEEFSKHNGLHGGSMPRYARFKGGNVRGYVAKLSEEHLLSMEKRICLRYPLRAAWWPPTKYKCDLSGRTLAKGAIDYDGM